MVMASLTWTLKAWVRPVAPRRRTTLRDPNTASGSGRCCRMEFKAFAAAGLLRLPCQIVRTGRRIVYRLLAWNPWAQTLIRLSQAMRLPLPVLRPPRLVMSRYGRPDPPKASCGGDKPRHNQNDPFKPLAGLAVRSTIARRGSRGRRIRLFKD